MKKLLLNWKNTFLFVLVFFISAQAYTQTATPPSLGDGSEGDPYQIATLDNLYWLTQTSSVWNKYFIQTSNINASGSSSWDSGKGFKPIGTETVKFTGYYNGKGHTISNVIIYRPDWSQYNPVGFFGYIENGRIDSLGLISSRITGYENVGVLAATNKGIINNCYTTGGSLDCYKGITMGGLVGSNYGGTIENCYSTVGISERAGFGEKSENLGGLVGGNGGTINKCYATGRIYGNEDIGGLVGDNWGTITNCFSTGNANGYYANNYGGIAGRNSGTIKYCYSTGDVGYYTYDRGGVVGTTGGSVKYCIYELLSDGGNGKAGTGLSAAEMKNFKHYLDAKWDYFDETYNGVDDVWGQNATNNNGYPFLDWQGYTNTVSYNCEEPFSATKKVIFETITKNTVELDSITTGGYITTGYVVFINAEKDWTIPTNGSIPTANSEWQNSGQQCIYSGTSQKPELVVTNLSPETLYYFKTYVYNECSGEELYEVEGKTDSILTSINNEQPTGDGSEGNPYEIETLANLSWLMYNDTTWDKHFIQTADIIASKSYTWNDSTGFISIGNETKSFTGSYNGKNHTIDSIYINKPSSNYIALFGSIKGDAKIDSLGLTNVNIKGKKIVGSIAAYSEAIITNCYAKGNVTGTLKDDFSYIGGLVGYNKKTITDCYSEINVSCTNGWSIGGLVGINYGASAKISNSYSLGSATSEVFVAGLVGYNYEQATIENSYSLCNVDGNQYVGGLVGRCNNNSFIKTSYSAGSVTGNYSFGGFVGSSDNLERITNCFWDKESSGQNTSSGGSGLTTAKMKDYRSYLEKGWDFMDETYNGSEDIWGHIESENSAYPFLKWQGYTNNYTCEAPYSPSSEIILENIQTTSFAIDSITNTGYGKIGTVIYLNNENSWTLPEEGETPTANNVWQDDGQQCVYIGSSTKPNLIISNLLKNKKYFLKAFVYNECEGTKKYEQTGLLKEQYTSNSFTEPTGDGSEGNPYVIATLENLAWVMYNDTVWDKFFIQTADIKATETINWEDGAGFRPIGNSSMKFSGKYNGKGFKIDSLVISRKSDNYIGLFGYTNDSQIDSLGLTNVNIKGNTYVGGLIGYLKGSINYSFVTGNVTGKITNTYTYGRVGGLIGECYGTVTNCFSNSDVESTIYMAGGLIGYLSSGSVESSYSKGNVSGNIRVGGLIGDNRGTVNNCYSSSNVTGYIDIGGLIGYNPGKVYSSYSTGNVTGTGNNDIGGLIGLNNGNDYTYNSFWDTETSGMETSTGGTGLTSSQMKSFSTYLEAGWDFIDESYNGTDDVWGLNDSENSGYPFLNWEGYTHTATLDCQAPLKPINNILFGEITSNTIILDSVSRGGYITTGYVIYINSENTFTAPTNDSEPTANPAWQNTGQQCIYIGSNQKPEITTTGLTAGVKYFFKVYAYNECESLKKFEQEGYSKYMTALPSGEGTVANPYTIANLDNLEWLMQNPTYWNKHFIQTANIDARDTKNWNDGKGFSPIGKSSETSFSGTYNGKGHIIDSLYIKSNSGYTALFGYTSAGTIIDSLGLTNIDFTSSSWSGSIVCYNYGTIRNSFATGKIYAPNASRVGGLVSHNVNSSAKLINCYTHVDVTAKTYVGGIAAFVNQAYIENCYSAGKVTATESHAGGMFPYSYATAIYNCFWDTETSEVTYSDGGTGKASYQMKNRYTFIDAGWDFSNETDNGTDDIWSSNCSENDGYPFLSWQNLDNNCEAPSESVSNITTSSVSSNSIKLESFTPAACGTKGYVAYINTTDSWTNPTDGENPTTNTDWQNSGQQCIYFGSSTSPNVTITNLTSCATYYIKVYAYTTCDGNNLFETTGSVKEYGLVDSEAPVPDIAILPEISGQCSVTISQSPTATDNCAGTVLGGITEPGVYTEQGTYILTWIYSDDYGNTSTQKQTIIVNDNIAPTINCISNQTKLIATSETIYKVIGTELDPSLTDDNCEVDSFYNNYNNLETLAGAEFNLGTTAIKWNIVDVNGNTSSCSFDVTVSHSTGINELDEMGISIYPNPVNDILNVSSNNIGVQRLTLYDLTGKVILEKVNLNQKEMLDISNLNSGIYFVNIQMNEKVFTTKIVKK